MQDAAMKRRLAAMVMAALLAISGAALASAYFAADTRAAVNTGNFLGGADIYGNTGSDQFLGLAGDDTVVGRDGNDRISGTVYGTEFEVAH